MFGNEPTLESIVPDPHMDALRRACLRFTCAHCGDEFSNRVPVRRSEFGPYFDTFMCAWKYAANLGDEKAAANVARIEAIV